MSVAALPAASEKNGWAAPATARAAGEHDDGLSRYREGEVGVYHSDQVMSARSNRGSRARFFGHGT